MMLFSVGKNTSVKLAWSENTKNYGAQGVTIVLSSGTLIRHGCEIAQGETEQSEWWGGNVRWMADGQMEVINIKASETWYEEEEETRRDEEEQELKWQMRP